MSFDIEGVLFPNVLTMAVQLCATIVLFLLCKKLLWVPARNILKARQDRMNSDLENARKLQEEAKGDLDEAKASLSEARNRSGEIVEQARKEADNLKEEIINSAKKEAANKLHDADVKIELKREEARQEIHDEMVTVAMAAVSRLLEETADSKDDEKAIKEYIKEVEDKR